MPRRLYSESSQKEVHVPRKPETFLIYNQFGFGVGLGTREAIHVMITLCEQNKEEQLLETL